MITYRLKLYSIGLISILLTSLQSICFAQTIFHGFNIDDQQLNNEEKTALLPKIYDQINIVESVGLSDLILTFFRKVPIVVSPNYPEESKTPALYNGTSVVINNNQLSSIKPIILHELLHAYHLKILSLNDPDITAAYSKAKSMSFYPQEFEKAHFLENKKEYFAVIGTIYLFGNIQQPPFNCELVAKMEPEFLNFLKLQFGEHHHCQ